jgi:hypothetical protein
LSFAKINRQTGDVICKDTLVASPVQMTERFKNVEIIEVENV